jgi:S-formylglutathione hydrolase FrmB
MPRVMISRVEFSPREIAGVGVGGGGSVAWSEHPQRRTDRVSAARSMGGALPPKAMEERERGLGHGRGDFRRTCMLVPVPCLGGP